MQKLAQLPAPNRFEVIMALVRGPKRNQHYVDMDGLKIYYEPIGSKKDV